MIETKWGSMIVKSEITVPQQTLNGRFTAARIKEKNPASKPNSLHFPSSDK